MRNNDREKVFVFGASGHGKVVIDIIERQGVYDIDFLVDDDPALKGREYFGYKVIGGKGELLDLRQNREGMEGIIAIGRNTARSNVAAWLSENGFRLISAIHPSALISRGVFIGNGTVLMAGAAVNADTVIGNNVIVNTGATIDHDCIIGNCVHIAPGVTLCGTVRIGNGTFIGAGTTVLPNISVGCNVVVGAGSTVVRDVPDGMTVIGTPARIKRKCNFE
jgi:sugar O-acyltransferase (sialic acid O-acetyltransferase NeuD family)